ncbi:MAG: hypothetical protein ACRDRJ_33610 [Streptosporangiaceae bacterium]
MPDAHVIKAFDNMYGIKIVEDPVTGWPQDPLLRWRQEPVPRSGRKSSALRHWTSGRCRWDGIEVISAK